MADDNSNICRTILNEFLLSPEINESLTLDDFRGLFPGKYRQHPDVKVLYQSFQLKRKKIRDTVKRNIKYYCQAQQSQQKKNCSEEDSCSDVEGQEKILQDELDSLEGELAAIEEQLQRCVDETSSSDVFTGLQKRDFNTKKLLEVEKLLGTNS